MPKLNIAKKVKQAIQKDIITNQSAQYELSAEQKGKIVDQICDELDYEEASRSEFMAIRAEGMKLFEGLREPKSDPWDGCSNVTTMLTAAHCKLMHARLMPAVWNTNLLYWKPIEQSDVDNVDSVKKFMDWAVKQDLRMQNIVDDAVNYAVVNGTIIFKVRWVPEYRWVSKRVLEGYTATEEPRYTTTYEYKKFEKPVIDIVEIEDYVQSGPDEQNCSYIIQSIYNTMADLKDMEHDGLLLKGSVTEVMEPKWDEMAKDGAREQKEKAEGFQSAEDIKPSRPVRVLERYGKYEIDGKMVDSVFTIAYETRTYLSGKPLTAVNMIGRRPFVVGALMRRPGRIWGQGLPELLRGLQKELDAIHNQRIDAGTISIAPFGVYRAASSFKPEVVKIGPGVMIPVDDVNDIKLMQFPANLAFSYQEERLIIEYIEKLSVMSAYSFGRESDVVKSRATATSTLALLSQSDQAFTILGLRLQEVISRLLTMILQYYQMYMPPGLAERVLGEDANGKLGLLFDMGLTPDTIAGNYDASMELDVSGGNKSMEIQASQMIVQMAPVLLQLATDPRGWEIAANFMTKIGYLETQKYLGPKPEAAPVQPGMPGAAPGAPGAVPGGSPIDVAALEQQLQTNVPA